MPPRPPDAAMHMQRIRVAYAYPVLFGHDVLTPENDMLAWAIARDEPGPHRCLFVIDAGVQAAWPGLADRIDAYIAQHPELSLAGPPISLPGGEQVKNTREHIEHVHAEIARRGIDRHATVVAIGGGALLDAVGYAAATAHRGVRLVRVPTTVLAQNDAGVGVKNGINAQGSKNFEGSFAPPYAVVNDAAWLRTLPARDRIAGLAEAVKVGLIRDAAFFAWIEANAAALRQGDDAVTARAIRRCAELHLDHIRDAGDPFEMGSARPLDYGHWAAHKLELLTAHRLRHGEAVAIGMLLDAEYAYACGDLPTADRDRLEQTLVALGLPTWDDALGEADNGTSDGTFDGTSKVLRGLEEFREHLGGQLTITLLQGVGRAHEVHDMDPALIAAAIEALRVRHHARRDAS